VIPLVISYGLDITAAIAIAAPVAVIANFLGQINIIGLFDLVYVPLGDKAAAEGNWKKLLYVSHVLPAVLNTAFKFVVAFMGVYAGTAATSLIINKIPESVMLGFGAAAGLMPAVGFAMFLALIGKMKFLPYFFVGFYLVKFAGLSTIVIGLIGLILGFIYMLNREGMNDSENLIGGN
ncbi:PTS sugar transporter subunit IIC, partial [Anaerofustis stercorihominis]|uniref:PTS sugar transporter subunit IIC n=1 Tax=Anaerofustis stercorihominis TaxID=214853 RepID=UPI00399464C9